MILAFDYGTQKIGVASGNELLGTATPLKALPCKNTQPNWDDIAALLKEWEPEALVVGLPLKWMAATVNLLSARENLPIVCTDASAKKCG
jgi:putative transcription antitermination factor YqgF